MRVKYLILSIFILNSSLLKSQTEVIISSVEFKKEEKGYKEALKNIKKAEEYYYNDTKGSYLLALQHYLEANKYNPDNPELNYKIGYCYLESIQKSEALEYLQKAYNLKKNVAPDIIWWLAIANIHKLRFKEALELLDQYKKSLSVAELNLQQRDINKKTKECEYGLIYATNPVSVIIENLTDINSIYPDYCPLISADESLMIFTSRRLGSSNNTVDKSDGHIYEDIYMSTNVNENWMQPENAGKPLNTDFHDATVGLSPDGQQMLVYRNGDLYICNLKGDKWTTPELLPSTINTYETENSACFSPDGKTIYFTRGKLSNTAKSNSDIWYSNKANGVWTEAVKLPKNINSLYDEDGVFMHPDGRTLFFSSKGHETMGGFDIFMTEKTGENTWSNPENLGFPINTPDDDIYFVLSANARNGYYSSAKQDSKGFTDIYKLIFQETQNQVTAEIGNDSIKIIEDKNTPLKNVKLIVVKGNIFDSKSKQPIEASIEIYDNSIINPDGSGALIATYTSNSKTGKYLVTLPSGKNYGLVVKSDHYLFHSENFDIPETHSFEEIVKNIELNSVLEGSRVILKNIFFDTEKSTLRPESFAELFRLQNLLLVYPELKIEISGHTDNKGNSAYNKKLSEDRAKAVVDYLIGQGIEKNRLTYRGASFDEPIETNETEIGRQMNRRVEFKIVR